jgi:hypothetical protein
MSAFMIGLGWEEFDGSRDRTQREANAPAAFIGVLRSCPNRNNDGYSSFVDRTLER